MKELPPIFCISLARDAARRARMTARLNALNTSYEIVDAIDGRDLDLSALGTRLRQDIMRRKKARNFFSAEVACYLSHYQIWERIAAENIPVAVVVEDDAVFSADFSRIAAAVADIPREWDAIHLAFRDNMKPGAPLCKISDSHFVCRPKTRMISMCGYALSASGAKKLAYKLREINDVVDWAFWEYWNSGAKCYAVFPRIVDNEDSPSNIAVARAKKASRAGRTFPELLRSKMWKFSESAKRRLYDLRHPVARTKGNA